MKHEIVYLKDVNLKMNTAEKKFITNVIDRYSKGSHPVPTPNTIGMFAVPFISEMLKAAEVSGDLTEEGRKYAIDLQDVLKKYIFWE